MAEENVFFLPVREFCRRGVVTCTPDDRVVDVASTMRERNVSGIVVREGETPVGIITDRDLRNKVVAAGADPREVQARAVMNAPLIAVGEDDYLFEVIYQMSKHAIHRVAVLDGTGQLAGIVTDSDIIQLQTNSPQQLVRDLEAAQDVEALAAIHRRVQELVIALSRAGVRTQDLMRLISYLNDEIVLRLIALLRRDRFTDLPEGFAFVVLGSEGRREQTLKTDQDNAIVYRDDLSAADVARVEAFATELIDTLIAIGVPPCPGGIMAKNGDWRRSTGGWTEVLSRWIGNPVPDNLLRCSMLFDVRTVWGDPGFERALSEHIVGRTREDAIFLARMAANVLRFPPPLGFFGRIKVEKKGPHRGRLDVKKAGIFAITEGVKALAMEAGILGGGTRERLTGLRERKVLTPKQTEDLEASFNLLTFIRLRGQVEAIATGREPSNHIAPGGLNLLERGRIRLAFEAVKSFQSFLRLHFQLNLVSR